MKDDPVVSRWSRVTVVVPTRDRPALLRRAVASVLNQTYPGPIECLVVFDETSPEMPSVTIEKNRELRIMRNERKPGLAGTRNTGAFAATGELLAFCDDDDEWLPDKLRLQVELSSQHEHVVVACGVFVCYGTYTVKRLPPKVITLRDVVRSRHMEVNPCTILVPTRMFLNEIGPVDENLPRSYAEDYEWVLRAANRTRIVSVRKPLVRINWHQASYYAGHWQTTINGLSYLLQKHPELQSDAVGLARIYGQIAFAHAALGERSKAKEWAKRCLSLDRFEPRGYTSLLVASGLVSADTILAFLQPLGRRI